MLVSDLHPLNRIRIRFYKRQLALLFFIAACAMPAWAAEKERAARKGEEGRRSVADASVLNEKGKSIRLSALKKEGEILVLVFVASTCPVTHLYWDRIKGVWYNYRDRNVAMTLVGGNSDDSADKIRETLEERDLELSLVWDEKHALARALGVEFTPEVVVIGKNWEVLYRGRMDDSWRMEGRARQRYLDAAVTAALLGQKTSNHVDDGFMGSRLR